MSDFQALKLHLVELLSMSRDALHIYVGMLVLVVGICLTRVRGLEWWALLVVAVVAVGLEVPDLRDDVRSLEGMQWSASFHDVANTLFWPAVLALLGRTEVIRYDRYRRCRPRAP